MFIWIKILLIIDLNQFFSQLLDRIRLCFYGKNPPAFNLESKTSNFNTFYQQIYYSLLPNSPNHLFLNPFDGCVKLAPALDLKENYEKYIQYSVRKILNFLILIFLISISPFISKYVIKTIMVLFRLILFKF